MNLQKSRHDFFDVLPIHPKPLALESLTGYLTRLGEANGIQAFEHIFAALFPSHFQRIADKQRDYPTQFIGDAAEGVGCTEEDLLRTTFYYLGIKFSRPTHPQALSRFLADCIAEHLRFCPCCLEDSGCYSLLWRFSFLKGCAKHGISLLDRCGNCGQRLPIIAAPLRLAVCQHCGANLRALRSTPLNETELASASAWTHTLEFLLQPQLASPGKNLAVLNHEERIQLREERGLGVAEVARLTGIPLMTLYCFERQGSIRVGAFRHYVAYASFLNIPLEKLFGHQSDK